MINLEFSNDKLYIETFDLVKFLNEECNYHNGIRPTNISNEVIEILENKLKLKLIQESYDKNTMIICFKIGEKDV